MDLLDTVLSTVNGEKYKQNIVKYDIDAATLTLLSDEDLQLIGVDDNEIRENLLQSAKTLQIPRESRMKLVVNKEYAQMVAHNINTQLNKHIANITCAVTRGDTITCDVKVLDGVKLLENTISSLEEQIKCVENKLVMKKQKKNKKLIGLLLVASLMGTIIVTRRIFK